ncbi:hypothetical protein DERF_012044 [Dermatophagoides farinae]|uniref:Uncharacterized protein n=1 Tax=Dermatophagoides farinae TaxID=6954 RepID=A0A922KWP3_DERFA|nr:hypothetical protein DERF_012044 [Dermatophagoides farinae]
MCNCTTYEVSKYIRIYTILKHQFNNRIYLAIFCLGYFQYFDIFRVWLFSALAIFCFGYFQSWLFSVFGYFQYLAIFSLGYFHFGYFNPQSFDSHDMDIDNFYYYLLSALDVMMLNMMV